MARSIVIGDESVQITDLLATYFSGREYAVQVVHNALALMKVVRSSIPSLIVLSTSLPEADSHELVKQLRDMPRTSHVPIICLAARKDYGQALSILEVGADDCVAKPFDLDELVLRIENAIERTERENMTDPRSGLPGAQLVNDHVRRLRDRAGWTYLDISIQSFEQFREVNGFVAADQVLLVLAGLMSAVVLAQGNDEDFVGHMGDEHFAAISFADDIDGLSASLQERFNQEMQTHYSFMDREAGFMTIYQGDEAIQVALMALAIKAIAAENLTT